MQHEVTRLARQLDELPREFHAVTGSNALAELAHDHPIDANVARDDKILGLASRRDARMSEIFL